ncbi:hypothetical protein [Caballeronia udeis]|uniref:hypothetical protein n=1 Tax=Caballeronia udeis TaxID=1232866 RepID=UPI003851599C
MSDGAEDEEEDEATAASSVEAANAGDAINTAKAKAAQSMRLIGVMGTETRKWKQRTNQQIGQRPSRPHDARMHHATAGEFYRVCVFAADSMNTVDTTHLVAT